MKSCISIFCCNKRLSTLAILLTFLPAALYGQDKKKLEPRKFKLRPVILELSKTANSTDVTAAAAAVRSLIEFRKVNDYRLAGEANQVLRELEAKAIKWGKKFYNPMVKSIAFTNADVDSTSLLNLHILRPKLVAFVDIPHLDNTELKTLDNLDSLENLTVEDCFLIGGHSFRDLHLPSLEILHLNGSGIQDVQLRFFNRKNLPRLKYINLVNTDVTANAALKLKKRMEAKGMKLQLKTD